MPKKLTQEEIQAIDNYSNEIKKYKDFQTGVRNRPGMYIGSLQNKGLRSSIKEIFQNAIDQMLDDTSPCNHVSLTYNQITKEVTVTDNGKGIPVDKVIEIMTSLHTSKNFKKEPYQYSAGTYGMGASIVNALSTLFVVESYKYDGTAYRIEFSKGYPKTNAPKPIKNKEHLQGTKIYFIPDETIFGEMTLDWKYIYKFAKVLMSLTPIKEVPGELDFYAIDDKGVKHHEHIVNKDGLSTILIMKDIKPINIPITCFADSGICRIETVFCYDSGDANGPGDLNVESYANWSPTMGGTHVDGVLDGISKWFCSYMNNIYLAGAAKNNNKKKKPLRVTPADTKTGLNIVIHGAHLYPEYSAQAKEVLSNPDMQEFARDAVMKGLDAWAKQNPKDLSILSKYLKDIAELRMKESGEKAKIANKYTSNVLTGYPRKFAKPLKEKKEFIIVEGDRQYCL